MSAPRILLVIGGGIAAYKSCELVRLIRKGGGEVTCVLTDSGAEFVTPMALAALSGNEVHTSLWNLKNEAEIGHIQLSREADLLVICPATANLMAKMAAGIADDLATTLILATDKPVLVTPAMNVRMWEHEATQRNVEWLRGAGVHVMQPDSGDMACGEFGPGRLPEPQAVWAQMADMLGLDPEIAGALPNMAEQTAQDIAPEGDLYEALEPEDTPEEEEYQGEADEGDAETRGSGYLAKNGGLGGLLSSIIPRSFQRQPEEVQDLEPMPEEVPLPGAEPEEEFIDDELPPEGGWPVEGEEGYYEGPSLPELEPLPDASPKMGSGGGMASLGSLLVSKGKAKSAPPTDREAINHELSGNGQAPEPFAGEEAAAPTASLGGLTGMPSMKSRPLVEEEPITFDPLEGQPAFEAEPEHRPLYGKHILITAGPTHEPIDPVRYLGNRSSGKQGYAIAAAAAAAGARVTLVSGPVHLRTPPGVERVDVESADDMAAAVKASLPADCAVMVAAVADWRTRDFVSDKIKKRGSAPPSLILTENPDILATVAASPKRPGLLIGFAAETNDVVANAKKKRKSKGVDWIVANDVSAVDGRQSVMGGDNNQVSIVREKNVDDWEVMSKQQVAYRLVEQIAAALNKDGSDDE